MDFKQFKELMQGHFLEMTKDEDYLFEVEVDKEEIWNVYLDNFLPQYNKIFRERRENDCSCCKSFIRQFGNVVKIKDNKITSVWDFVTNSENYDPPIKALSKYIHSKTVNNVYISKFKKVGTDKNREMLEDGTVRTWHHFYIELPEKFVDKSSKTVGDIQGSFRDTRNVFKRSLEEISEQSITTVLELVSSNTLYKGQEWKSQLQELLKHKKVYNKLSQQKKENYAWEHSVKVGAVIGRIKNHSIGVLLVDISDGIDLDKAVKRYEKIVAPSNYKRPKPIYTKKMLEDAKKKIQELGYMGSLNRRFASLDDITINNVLFSNKDSSKKIAGADIFDEMESEISINPKKFSKVQEISIDKFIKDVLPTTKNIEVLVENKHTSNFVSLIAPENIKSKTMFKWDNNFSWAYSGNVTDNLMKERVKSAGGKVDGVLRFSIQWNDMDKHDANDLDAHCIEPDKNRIYFSNSRNVSSTGQLDVDIRNPRLNSPAVENITWSNLEKMQEGTYKFLVNQYENRGGKEGFRAEIEFGGETYTFNYRKELNQNEFVEVAEVTLRDGVFNIKEKLPSTCSSKGVWNINTNQFVPVSVISYSPNYWDEQKGIGHQHVFFFLKDCINSEQPNGFYNEFLNQELNENRKVMEALGSKLSVKDTNEQLSGLGFSLTKRNELLVNVIGNTERILKIKF